MIKDTYVYILRNEEEGINKATMINCLCIEEAMIHALKHLPEGFKLSACAKVTNYVTDYDFDNQDDC